MTEKKQEKRVYNLNMDYLKQKFEEHKTKTGVSQTAVFAAIGKQSSYRQTIENSGIATSDLYKICVLIGLNTSDKKLYIGGVPMYEKPQPQTAEQVAIEEIKKQIMCLTNENIILKERIDFIEKELGVSKPKEVSIVKKIV